MTKRQTFSLDICGFPKSGNTWLTLALNDLLVLSDGEESPVLDIHQAIKFSQTFPRRRLNDEDWYLVKSHFRKDRHLRALSRFSWEGADTRYIIHLLRNPMDVFLSYLNYMRLVLRRQVGSHDTRENTINSPQKAYLVEKLGWRGEIADFIQKGELTYLKQTGFLEPAIDVYIESDFLIDPIHPISGSWIEHYQSWRNQGEKAFTVKYEDLIRNPASIADQFIASIGPGYHSMDNHLNKITNEKLNKRNAGLSFYNMARSWYCLEYMSKNNLQKLIEKHEGVLMETDYLHHFVS